MSIEDINVVVTGAARGIGRAIALRLAADGANVAVVDLNAAGADAVAEEVRVAGRKAVSLGTDVTDRDAVFAMISTAAAELGSVDVCVSNAGVAQVKPLLDVTEQDLQQLFRVNVFGVLYCLQAAAEQMRLQGTGGKIINAASIAGHSGFDMLGAYSATKFGVIGMTQAAAKELAADRITVNAYCPGIVDTDMWEFIDERMGGYLGLAKGEAKRRYGEQIALGRLQQPEDVASFVSYLAGPDADYMTGQSGVIDGGVLMR